MMLRLAPLLALSACTGSTGSGDDVCSFEFETDDTSDRARRIGTMIADDDGVYQIHVVVRWSDKMGDPGTAPIALTIQGGWNHEGTPVSGDDPRLDTSQPVVDIHLDLPEGGLSGGTNDRRGPIAAAAVASVLRWAQGEGVDAGGCALSDRIPAANGEDLYLIGPSNGGNLAIAVLTDDTLNVPPISGLVTWETPASAGFANVELGNDPSVYTPGSCTWDPNEGILCDFPKDQLISVEQGGQFSTICFDVDEDGDCTDTDPEVHGSESKETEDLMLSPAMRRAVDEVGLTVHGYAPEAEADEWWSYRDGGRRLGLLVERWPALPVILIGSEEDHVITTWSDHPHIHGLGQAMQESGVFWTRLNPGDTWHPANTSPNAPNLTLSLDGDSASLLTEEQEDPLSAALTGAVLELSSRNASGDWE